MNKGFKSHTKTLTQSVNGLAEIAVNLNKSDSNMHITVPLISTVGKCPISTSLIFCLTSKNEQGNFGKGTKLNWYSKIDSINGGFQVTNADGTTDAYFQSNEYKNPETNITLTRVYDDAATYHYELSNEQGDCIEYEPSAIYPSTIKKKNGDEISFECSGIPITISNTYGDEVNFSGDTKVKVIEYMHNNVRLSRAVISYDNNDYISDITYYNSNNEVTGNVKFSISDTQIIVTDAISGYRIKYMLSDTEVTSITDGYNAAYARGNTVTIARTARRTTVTNNHGQTSYIIFDKENYPAYEIDSSGNAVRYFFDKTTSKLIGITNTTPLKDLGYNIADECLPTEVTTEIRTVTHNDPLCQLLVGPSVLKYMEQGTLTYDIPVSGIATDTVTAVVCGRFTDNSYEGNPAPVELSLNGESSATVVDEISDLDGEMCVCITGITAESTYSSIRVKITRPLNSIMEVGDIRVFKRTCGAFYTYDECGNLIESISGNNSASAEYNASSLVEATLNIDSTSVHHDYDSKKQIQKSTHSFGATVEYEYNGTSPTKTTVVSGDSNTRLEASRTYTSDGRFVSEETNVNGLTRSYTYADECGKIASIHDSMNVITNYEYLDNDLLSALEIKNANDTSQASALHYTYDNKNRISQIVLDGGKKYVFTYDEFNNITEASLGGKPIFNYTYDSNNRLISQKFANMSGYFKFTYNSKSLLDKIYYVKNDVETLNFTYIYDIIDRVSEVLDGSGQTVYSYTYDDDGRISNITRLNASIDYGYDNLGNVNSKKILSYNKKIYQSFDTVNRSKGSHPGAIKNSSLIYDNMMFFGLFDESSQITNAAGEALTPIEHNGTERELTVVRNGLVPCCNLDSSRLLSYEINGNSSIGPECGFVSFCFKPDTLSEQCLFSATSSDGNEGISVHLNTGGVIARVLDNNGTTHTLFSSYGVKAGEWNYFALSFMHRDDGQGYDDITHIIMNINGAYSSYNKKNPSLHFSLDLPAVYNIGHYYNGNSASSCFSGYVTCVCIAPGDYVSDAYFKEHYRLVKEYALNSMVIRDDESFCTVDFSDTNLYTTNSDIQNQFEIFPLHSSIKSLNGTEPIAFNIRQISDIDKDRSFEFNKDIKRYAYVADGLGHLKYRMNGNGCTVMMRACIDESRNKQYFFDLKDTQGNTLGVYRDDHGCISLNLNGTNRATLFEPIINTWHTLGLSFIGSGSEKALLVFWDGMSESFSASFDFNMGDIELLVGDSFTAEAVEDIGAAGGTSSTTNPLCGQIEMLATSSAFCDENTLDALMDELVPHTKTSEYDDLGMLRVTSINHGDAPILSNVITYNKLENGNTTLNVESEILTLGNTTVPRTYTTDAYGRVTSITDRVFGNHTYAYDYRGFLVEEDGMPITYDNDGNMIRYGHMVYLYDEYNGNRLKSYGNRIRPIDNPRIEISYNSNGTFNPDFYDGKTLTYQGRRLTNIQSDTFSASYSYDDKGLRTVKSVTKDEVTTYTHFIYDGDRLVTEYTPQGRRMDYLYDDNGKLYGFIYDGNKYFYVRDHLQNILGVVDSTGSIVVKYDYTAYGVCKSITGTMADTIGVYNHMRYKGYYFDEETGFFYCLSRYYVPEWCRFLNADHIAFANQSSPVGMNLFAYCGNNPINRIDLNGNSFWDSMAEWAAETFGAFLDISYTVIKETYDYLFVGFESGIIIREPHGDNTKPISVFATKAVEKWRFWEYQVGIQAKIKDFSASLSLGFFECNLSLGLSNETVDLQAGINKIGIRRSSIGDNGDVLYYQYYIRTIPTAIAIALIILAPEALPVVTLPTLISILS